jgi:sec-independent protein translocase protein TatA
MGKFGTWEIVIIAVVILILFGGTKLASAGKSLGKSVREFKSEVHADDDKKNDSSAAQATTTDDDNKTDKE